MANHNEQFKDKNDFKYDDNVNRIQNDSIQTKLPTKNDLKSSLLVFKDNQAIITENSKDSLDIDKHQKKKRNPNKSTNYVKYTKTSLRPRQFKKIFKNNKKSPALIFEKKNCKKIKITNLFINYSADEIIKLSEYSIDNINLGEFNKDYAFARNVIQNKLIGDQEKNTEFYKFIIRNFCNINDQKNLIVKKSFILLSFSLCELIPFIYFFNNNHKNLFTYKESNENVYDVIDELLLNLKNIVAKYYEGLIFLYNYKKVKEIQSMYLLNVLNRYIILEIMKLRFSFANLNQFLTKDKKIINYYWHFVTITYDIKNKSFNTRNYEIILFFAYFIDKLETNKLFKNSQFDEENKYYLIASPLLNKYICRLFAIKDIIDNLNNDIYKFYEYLNENYLRNRGEINQLELFQYITTVFNKIYLKNVGLPYLAKNECFYVTNCDYLMSVYLNVFSKMIKYAINNIN